MPYAFFPSSSKLNHFSFGMTKASIIIRLVSNAHTAAHYCPTSNPVNSPFVFYIESHYNRLFPYNYGHQYGESIVRLGPIDSWAYLTQYQSQLYWRADNLNWNFISLFKYILFKLLLIIFLNCNFLIELDGNSSSIWISVQASWIQQPFSIKLQLKLELN